MPLWTDRPGGGPPPEGWVEVFTGTDDGELMVVEGLLKGEGISVRRSSGRLPQFPFTLDGLAAASLWVPEEEAARAVEILGAENG